MKCPSCQYKDTQVLDSRLNANGTSIRRRRKCLKCAHRFTTHEYVEAVSLLVIKKDGRRQPFDRARMMAGIMKACEKRPISVAQIEFIVTDIERALQKKYEREVPARDIGELIMKRLSTLDEVAYVRFASVYRQFQDVNQFMDELKTILEKDKLEKSRRAPLRT